MDWPIQDIARMTGTTSRTLRHYDDVGLLAPSRTGNNGYRFYDQSALLRLQRILLLRGLGIGLNDIAGVLNHELAPDKALQVHLRWLQGEHERLGVQIASVRATLAKLEKGEQLMAEEMFNGFDHTGHREEVEQRWGKDAYAAGDTWWRSKTPAQQREYQQQHEDIAADYGRAKSAGFEAGSDQAQAIAGRHFDWLQHGAQARNTPVTTEYLAALAQMYPADPRFAAQYGGTEGATYVRDVMKIYAQRGL